MRRVIKTIGFAAISGLIALSCSQQGRIADTERDCTPAEPIRGVPGDYVEPEVADSVTVSEPVACDESKSCEVVSLERTGEHPMRFGRGCLRCESGRFVELDEREVRSRERDEIFARACDEGTHAASDGCEIFSDMFLMSVVPDPDREADFSVYGYGLSCLDPARPQLSVRDYGELGDALRAVADAMEAWDVDGVIDVAACGVAGRCLLESE